MYREVTKDFLKTIPLFSGLSEEEFGALERIVKLRTFGKGEILHYEKDRSDELYYLYNVKAALFSKGENGSDVEKYWIQLDYKF